VGKIKIITAMLIFGSIGLFVKNIPLSSSEIALYRGVIGCIFLVIASVFLKKKLSFITSKRNLWLLFASGGAIGFNWIFLFEAYRYTTISNATLSYYFAPVIVMLLAPFILKEKWTWVKALSIVGAMMGLFLIVSTDSQVEGVFNHPLGIMYGLLAASLYASVIMMNKFIKGISDIETTLVQLFMASIVLLPYVLMTNGIHISEVGTTSIFLILIVGIVHTGIAYLLYFSSMKQLNGQTIALLSYVDPISAVVMAAIILNESMTWLQILGGLFILGSALLSEWKKH